jgi:hypothetical protein
MNPIVWHHTTENLSPPTCSLNKPHTRVTIFSFLDSLPLKMEQIRYSETSVRNYHYLLRNNAEEHSSHFRGGSLKSCIWLVLVSHFPHWSMITGDGKRRDVFLQVWQDRWTSQYILRFAVLRGIFFCNSTIRLLVRPSYNTRTRLALKTLIQISKTFFFWELRGVVCIRILYTVSIFPGISIAYS